MPLELSIMTNAGNATRETTAQIAEENLEAAGFDITLELIDFPSVVGRLLSQQYDMIVIGWTSLGSDPEDSVFWAYRNDNPGAGFNFVSYYNSEVESNLWEAKTLPGCSTGRRGNLYREIQTLIHGDAPYVFLYNSLGNVVWNTRLQGVYPGSWSTYYNVEEWYVVP